MPMISNQSNSFCDIHFIFRENSILLEQGALPSEETVRRCLLMNVAEDWFTEIDRGYSALLLEKNTPNPKGCEDIPLREFFHKMQGVDRVERFISFTDETKKISGEELSGLASRAMSLLKFKNEKRFCPKCGSALNDDPYFTARICPKCKKQHFPQIEPCIIVLVSKGEQILLARHKNRNDGVFSCIAGFVESGETVENAVRREVLEETGLKIKNIRYVKSQPWPFPDQLMLAFRAEYDSGEIKIQEEEISEAAWFSKKNLPKTPSPGSVAYSLIHDEI